MTDGFIIIAFGPMYSNWCTNKIRHFKKILGGYPTQNRAGEMAQGVGPSSNPVPPQQQKNLSLP
jgi:hypothetical protein